MKKIGILLLIIFSQTIIAKQVLVVHYLGDTKPLTVEVPMIVNKDLNTDTLENSILTFVFDQQSTLGLNADFNISVEGNNISIEGNSINKSIIEVETKKTDEKNYTAYVKFVPSDEIMAPIQNGITIPEFSNNQMVFVTGNLSKQELYNLKLKIVRKHLFKSDEVVFNRNLQAIDYHTENLSNNKTKVTVDLKKVTDNNFDTNKKNEITVTMALSYNFKNVVNLKQLGPTIVERTKVIQNVQ